MHFNPSLPLQEILNIRAIHIESLWFLLIQLLFYQRDILLLVCRHTITSFRSESTRSHRLHFTSAQKTRLHETTKKKKGVLARRWVPPAWSLTHTLCLNQGLRPQRIPLASPPSYTGSGLVQSSCLLVCFLLTWGACGGRLLSRRREDCFPPGWSRVRLDWITSVSHASSMTFSRWGPTIGRTLHISVPLQQTRL